MKQRVLAENAVLPFEPRSSQPCSSAVVLVHGLFASKRSMRKAENYLKAYGFATHRWGYPTFFRSIEQHAERLAEFTTAIVDDRRVDRVYFLTHSLGGILVRKVLADRLIPKLCRIVMLAPPNAGSHLTRVSLGPFRAVLPSIVQISERPDSIPNQLPPIEGVDVGVIAASRDFVVHLESTRLREQRDHAVVTSSHFELPSCSAALELAVQFFNHGHFGHQTLSAVA